MYYDNRGRVVKTHSTNHLGGKEIECLAYNFTGQPTKTLHIHDDNKKTKVQEEYAYNYDHAGRLKETAYSLDNATPIVLSMNEYDELGRLKSVKRANNVKLQNNYTYNIRSWTKSITSPLFTQDLYYNESNGSNTPSYNGNISRTKWKHGTDAEKSYNFTYDALSQLKEASYSGVGQYGANYTYDMHGNMLTLERKGKTDNGYGAVDKLSMVYNGNQLVNVIDKGDNVKLTQSSDFKDYSNGKGVYEYNANGAMVKDTHKGISKIEYNSLNLPVSIAIDNGQGRKGSVQYLYSATGVKLQTIHKTDGAAQRTPMAGAVAFDAEMEKPKTTDYVGNKIYENDELVKILVDGGYYDVKEKKYYFYIQDHLGNNRVVADAQGTVVQKSDYYPFGMEFADNTAPDEQPYKYNGKQLDKQNGLNMYDYSARYMEPAIGRFTSVDPLAEKYYSISPYAYVGNNPIKRIDPTGMNYEEPVKLFSKKEEQAIPFQVGSPIGDGHFYLISHGTPSTLFTSEGNLAIPEDIDRVMSKHSPEWKKAMAESKEISLTLYTCNSGTEGNYLAGNSDNLTIVKGRPDPIAKRFSAKYRNVRVVGFNGQFVFGTKNGKVYGSKNQKNKGSLVTYYKGKRIRETPFNEPLTELEMKTIAKKEAEIESQEIRNSKTEEKNK